MSVAVCPGCRLEMPSDPGAPIHRYFDAGGECWSLFGEATAFQYANPVVWGRAHQPLVDAYAVQHAGGAHPPASVDTHLVALHLVLERAVPASAIPPLLQRLASSVDDWPVFDPPRDRGRMTILDVALADDPVVHIETVEAWARQVWATWRPHHPAVARLAADHLGPAGSPDR